MGGRWSRICAYAERVRGGPGGGGVEGVVKRQPIEKERSCPKYISFSDKSSFFKYQIHN